MRIQFFTFEFIFSMEVSSIRDIYSSSSQLQLGKILLKSQSLMLEPECEDEVSNRDRSRATLSRDPFRIRLMIDKCAKHPQTPTYFDNIARYLKETDLVVIKKHSILDEGLYILLFGKVAYIDAGKPADSQRRQQLLNAAKSGSFTAFSRNPFQPDPQLAKGYSLVIEQSFAPLLCEGGNIMVIEEAAVFRVGEFAREKTNFDRNIIKLKELCESSYIKHRTNEGNSLFSVNQSLLHTFKFYHYPFGSAVTTRTLAIVSSGTMRPRCNQPLTPEDLLEDGRKYPNLQTQIQKFGIIAPNTTYEVTSAHSVVMQFENNPTLTFYTPLLTRLKLQPPRRIHEPLRRTGMQFFNKKRSPNTFHCRPDSKQPQRNRHEAKSHLKVLKETSKRCDPYIIVSMFACEMQNGAVKSQIAKHKVQEEGKYKAPTVLFDFTKSKTNKIMPSLKRMFEQNQFSNHQTRKNTEAKIAPAPSGNYLSYYQNYSKHLSRKFRLHKAGCALEEEDQGFENWILPVAAFRNKCSYSQHASRGAAEERRGAAEERRGAAEERRERNTHTGEMGKFR